MKALLLLCLLTTAARAVDVSPAYCQSYYSDTVLREPGGRVIAYCNEWSRQSGYYVGPVQGLICFRPGMSAPVSVLTPVYPRWESWQNSVGCWYNGQQCATELSVSATLAVDLPTTANFYRIFAEGQLTPLVRNAWGTVDPDFSRWYVMTCTSSAWPTWTYYVPWERRVDYLNATAMEGK